MCPAFLSPEFQGFLSMPLCLSSSQMVSIRVCWEQTAGEVGPRGITDAPYAWVGGEGFLLVWQAVRRI
jgi:hypothetical protein